MKIGIDTSILAIDNAGSAVYTKALLANLKIIDNLNVYELFSYGDSGEFRRGKLKRKFDNIIRDIFWGQFCLPRRASLKGVDVLHCPAFKAPLRCKMPLIVTFYDIHILRNMSNYNLWFGFYCKLMLKEIAMSADKIITISEFSKKDILDTFPVSPDKVVVTYCGVSERFKVIADTSIKSAVRKKYRLNKDFILYVGAIQPRKNLKALLLAFSELKKSKRIDYALVFAGGSGWRNKEIHELIQKLNIGDDVMMLGYVSDSDLPVIYNLAEFFVYPSFFEGFGMPVLEAMACGCPVITSDTSSLPEVVGNAGIKINPYSDIELRDAMERLSGDGRLRMEMRVKGLERAKIFSWARCARDTLNVYREFS